MLMYAICVAMFNRSTCRKAQAVLGDRFCTAAANARCAAQQTGLLLPARWAIQPSQAGSCGCCHACCWCCSACCCCWC